MKKAISLFLCIVMCFSLISGFAMAETTPTCNIVSIGDSTSNGFGLADYGHLSDADWGFAKDHGSFYDSFGFHDYASKDSYPYKLAEYIKGLGNEVNLKNLSLEGMRTDELRGILDPEWGASVPAAKGIAGDGHYAVHMDWYNEFFTEKCVKNPEIGTASITEYFTDAIKNADVITVDITMNNFGVYLSNRMLALLSGRGECGDYTKYSENVSNLADELDIDVAAVKTTIMNLVSKYIDLGEMGDMANALIDTLVYCYCDFRVNFQADIGLIRELNDHAKIIAVGSYNFMKGLVCTFNGIEINLGDLWGTVSGMINTFITGTCKYKGTYSYADCSKGVEMYIDNLAMAETPDDIYPNYRWWLKDTLPTCPEENFIKAAKYSPLDLTAALDAMNSGGGLDKVGIAALMDWENASEGAKGVASVYVRFMCGHGMGAHPDLVGNGQKFAAVKAAYDSSLNASSSGDDAAADMGLNFFSAVLNALKNPVLDAIASVFDKIVESFESFFDSIFGAFC